MRAATGGGKLSVVDAADARAEFRRQVRGGACAMRAATGGGKLSVVDAADARAEFRQ